MMQYHERSCSAQAVRFLSLDATQLPCWIADPFDSSAWFQTSRIPALHWCFVIESRYRFSPVSTL